VISAPGLAVHVRTLLADRLTRPNLRFVCLAVLAMNLLLLAGSFATSDRGRTAWGPPLGADYAGFYTAGTVLNRYPPARLYDPDLHDRLYHELLPNLGEEQKLPYVHPPFVAFALRPLAQLPYGWSFAVWLVISAALYLTGLLLTCGPLRALSPEDRRYALLLALSFEPFVMECWMGGQLSVVGFCCLAAAFAARKAGRPFLGGIFLGLCLYKPTLLVLLLPLLLVGRQARVLAGVCLIGLVLAAVSLLAVGAQGCLDYAQVVLGFTQTTTSAGDLTLRTWKYVDGNSFYRLLLGSSSALNWLLWTASAVVPLAFLGARWGRLHAGSEGYRDLLWASTLTWTLVINLYVGIYDAVLVVPAALITADVLLSRRTGKPGLPPAYQLLLVLLFVTPWITQPFARATGVQLMTLVLAGLAAYQLTLARRPPSPVGTSSLASPHERPCGMGVIS
jgi:hypothetical protein